MIQLNQPQKVNIKKEKGQMNKKKQVWIILNKILFYF